MDNPVADAPRNALEQALYVGGIGSGDPGTLDNESLARLARTCITRHCTRLGGAGDLANALSVSAARLAEIYAQQYDESPDDAILREKFRFAERLLAETSVSLADIAASLGYVHPADFAEDFGHYVGMSPWSFRHLPYSQQIELIGGIEGGRTGALRASLQQGGGRGKV